MRNFKFYNYNIKKFIKSKIVPLTLVGTMGLGLTACSQTIKKTSKTQNQISTYSSAQYEDNKTLHEKVKPTTTTNTNNSSVEQAYEEYKMENQEVNLNEDENQTFQNYIDNYQVQYKNSDLFGIDEALSKYSNLPKASTASSNVVKNNSISEQELLTIVKQNNKQFLSEINNKKYTALSDQDLNKAVSVVSKQLNSLLQTNENIDVNELDSTLTKLKIVGASGFGIAYVSHDTQLLGISMNAINNLQKNSRNQNRDVFESIIGHEATHLAQISYPTKGEFASHLGPSYTFTDLDVNALDFEWYTEGSAEVLALSDPSDQPINYADNIKGLETLTLSTITDEDNQVDTIQKLSLGKDLDGLYDYFNADSDSKKKEVIEMMYSYNIIYTTATEFVDKYKSTKGDMNLVKLDDYRDELKGSIGTTLTKVFYSNLANKITKEGMGTEDIFFLMRIYETEMCRFTDYDNTYKASKTSQFMNDYSSIQNNFFEIVGNNIGKTKEKLKQEYDAYSDAYCNSKKGKTENTYELKYNINSLGTQKNQFIKRIGKSRISHIYANINR